MGLRAKVLGPLPLNPNHTKQTDTYQNMASGITSKYKQRHARDQIIKRKHTNQSHTSKVYSPFPINVILHLRVSPFFIPWEL